MVSGVILNIVVLFAVFDIGSCLKCYQCRSEANPECNDTLTAPLSKFLVDCNKAATKYNDLYLRQILNPELMYGLDQSVIHMNLVANPTSFVCLKYVQSDGMTARTCLAGYFPEHNLTVASALCRYSKNITRYGIKTCSVCDEDQCNASTALNSSLPVLLYFVFSSYIFYKQQ